MGSGFGEELFEILQEVGCAVEQARNLGVNLLYGLLLSLVCLEDFEELLVDFGLILEAVLQVG